MEGYTYYNYPSILEEVPRPKNPQIGETTLLLGSTFSEAGVPQHHLQDHQSHPQEHQTGLIIIGQYKAITAQNGFNRRIFDECQEAQDNQFFGFLGLKLSFLSSGTPKIGSGRSNLYIGRWSRACPVVSAPVFRTKDVFYDFIKTVFPSWGPSEPHRTPPCPGQNQALLGSFQGS